MRVWNLECYAEFSVGDLGFYAEFRVWGLGFQGCRAEGLGFGVSKFRVQG